ncbi:DUF58 domain-containing protein [Pendulispora albinea]|uniref:DUF58 domain-containing protein n=1 Tax=Pendulispora albinea TaxID=2741071 RepID=A0ABZ2M5A8_9BACT
MSSAQGIRQKLDWGKIAPLRLRSRLVAEGVYAGGHRSARRGAGVEFGGHRAYTPGDDLRWLDRRSLLLHDRLLVRQFETETDRALRLVVDRTASMGYRGSRAPGAKLAWSALVAAALGRVAIESGDPVGLTLFGGLDGMRNLPVSGGRESFERLIATLELLDAQGDALADARMLDRALGGIARAARRGSVIVFLSDLLDLPEGAMELVAGMAARGRVLVVVQTLDPDEATLPFEGTVRLRGLEGGTVVETDVETTRQAYLAALGELGERWERGLLARGGRFVRALTTDDPVRVVRSIIEAAH